MRFGHLCCALLLLVGDAAASTIITDFNSSLGTIGPFGNWTWDSTYRELSVIGNTPDDRLDQHLNGLNYKDIAGATAVSLTGKWDEIFSGNRTFKLDLQDNGGTFATATFSFADFAGSTLTTISAPLTWVVSDPLRHTVSQWVIQGTGSSSLYPSGLLGLTEMAVTSVPECEPRSCVGALFLALGALAIVERGRSRAAIAA